MVTLGFEHREKKDEESTYAPASNLLMRCTSGAKKIKIKIKKNIPPEPNNDFVGNDTPCFGVMHAPYNHIKMIR